MPQWLREFVHFLVLNPAVYVLCWILIGIFILFIHLIIQHRRESGYRIRPGITKKGLCQSGLVWCQQTLGKARNKPELVMSYARKPMRRLGAFRGLRQIVIYINQPSNRNMRQLANTIIHEYAHALQFNTIKQHMRYDEETRRVGYHNNPFEVEARQIADRHETDLLEYWKEKGLIG